MSFIEQDLEYILNLTHQCPEEVARLLDNDPVRVAETLAKFIESFRDKCSELEKEIEEIQQAIDDVEMDNEYLRARLYTDKY